MAILGKNTAGQGLMPRRRTLATFVAKIASGNLPIADYFLSLDSSLSFSLSLSRRRYINEQDDNKKLAIGDFACFKNPR